MVRLNTTATRMIDTPCSTKALRRSSSVSVQDPDIKRTMLDRTLDDFDDIGEAAAHLIKFELAMLAELGFGLDLETCAATGETSELIYVSPKSGSAVSRQAGDPWRDRLLRLPAFLRQGEGGPNGWSDQDLQDGFQLTGLFLLRHVLEPRGQGHSDARDGFINAVTKHRARVAVP